MKQIEITLAYSTDISPSQVRGSFGDFHSSCHLQGDTDYLSLISHSGLGTVNLNIPDDEDIEFEEYELILSIKNSQRKGDWHLNIPEITSKKIKKVTIKGLNNTNFQLSSLIIQNISIEIIIENGLFQEIAFSGNENLSIVGSKIINGSIRGIKSKKLTIINSDLGKCYLFNLNIENLIIKNSNLNNIQISNVNIAKVDTKGMGNQESKELYRHLKYLFDQIGNKTEANKFFAKEMEYYMKSLKELKDWKNYGVALVQKEVSDFGQDWTRAFWVYLSLIFIGFISYQIYQVSDPKLIFDYSCEGFKKGIVDFTELANPIPKVEEIKNPLYLLFSIAKILIVYQIIVALRRISQR